MHKHVGMNRRSFLKAACAGATVPLLLPASARGANERIRMGVIGTGSRGVQVMMEGFVPDNDVEVVLVCDPQQARRDKAAKLVNDYHERNECAACNDFREVLERDDIDAVLVAAPDHWHGVIATMAANAGKDMYCEKPLGLCVREGQAIRDAVRRNDIIFQTGTQQRSTRNFRHACELALGGYLGEVKTIEVAAPGPSFEPKYDGSLDPQPIPEGLDWEMYVGPAPMKPYNPGRLEWPDWYLISDYCVGFIVNWGVHHLDIAQWGCPRLITQPFECHCEADYRNKGFTDNINGWKAEYEYPDGLRMRYSDTDNPWPQGVCFRGDEGWVHVSRKDISAEPASLLELALPPGQNRLHESNHHARDFIDAVKARRDPVSPVESGHQASNLGLIPEIAARLKRPVRWDPIAEQFEGDAEATALLSHPLRAPWQLG